jgi:hypothetical protein
VEIIKVTPSMKFLLEVDKALPERESEAILAHWNTVFPDNKLLIIVKGSIKILDIKDE